MATRFEGPPLPGQGYGSAIDRREYEEFMARRKAVMGEFLESIRAASQATVDRNEASAIRSSILQFGPESPLNQPVEQSLLQMHGGMFPALGSEDYERLLGAAEFWNIEDPEKITPDELFRIIEEKRAGVERPESESPRTLALGVLGGVSEFWAQTARIAGNVAGLVEKVPYAEDALREIAGQDGAQGWFYKIGREMQGWSEEAMAAQPEQAIQGYRNLASIARFGSYIYPGVAAWKAAGLMGRAPIVAGYGAKMSPIARGAIQGLTSTAILEAGSDKPQGEKNSMYLLGAGLGALAPVIGPALAKVRARFGSRFDAQADDAFNAWRRQSQEVEAEWWFADELGAGGRAGGQRLLGPGAAPTVPPGGASPVRAAPTPLTGPISNPPAPSTALAVPASRLGVRVEPYVTPSPVYPTGLGAASVAPESRQLMGPLTPEAAFEEAIYGVDLAQDRANWMNLFGRTEARNPVIAPPSGVTAHFPALARSRVVKSDGSPKLVFHGTKQAYDVPDWSKLSDPEQLLYGPGYYTTEDPSLASEYAGDFPRTDVIWRSSGDRLLRDEAERVAMADELQRRVDAWFQSNPDFLINSPPEVAEGLHWQLTNANDAVNNVRNGWDARAEAFAESFQALGIPIDDLVSFQQIDFPNVRPMFLNIERPFEIEGAYSRADLAELMAQHPAIEQQLSLEFAQIERNYIPEASKLAGEDVYYALQRAYDITAHGPRQNPVSGFLTSEPAGSPKAAANQWLEAAGFDGITHTGGRIMGNREHQVWIAFRPEQIHSPWTGERLIDESAREAAQSLTKQATIMESESLPDALAETQMGDGTLVRASASTNPGGVSVVKNVGNLVDTIDGANQLGMDFWVIPRGEQLDLVIAPNGGDFTAQKFGQYQQYGFFEGMRVTTASGIEGIVKKVGATTVLQRAGGGPPLKVKAENILPSRFGPPMIEAPAEWNSFRAEVMRYVDENARAAGMAPVEHFLDARVQSMLPVRREAYFDARGINSPAERHALSEYFDQQYVAEMQSYVDPEIQEIVGALEQEVTAIANRNVADEIAPSLEELASRKGFTFIAAPGNGGVLRDAINPEAAYEVPIATDAGVVEFLKNVDREIPELSPPGVLPEVMSDLGNPSKGTTRDLDPDDFVEAVAHNNRELEAALRVYEGAGGPPAEPPEPPLWGPPPGEPFPALPPGSFGAQVESFLATGPEAHRRLGQLIADNTNLRSRILWTRYRMIDLQTDLDAMGLDMGMAFQQVDAVEQGIVQAHNAMGPWLDRGTEVLRKLPREIMRDGSFARIHEIQDLTQRMLAWDDLGRARGYGIDKMRTILEVDDEVTKLFHDFFVEELQLDPRIALEAEREIFRYIPHVRARQAQGLNDPYDVQYLSPEMQFFGEYVRGQESALAQTDIRNLYSYMVRAAMNKKYVSQAWETMIQNWQDPRIPAPLKDIVLDWAQVARHGYSPGGDIVQRGLQWVMQSIFKTKITSGEARKLVNAPINFMYQGMLGGRPSVIFRDSTQFFNVGAKVGPARILDTFRYVANRDNMREALERGVQGGWIELGQVPVEAAGIFENQQGVLEELRGVTPSEDINRRAFERVGDVLHDVAGRAPGFIRSPRLKPLHAFSKLGEYLRLLSGEAGYRHTGEAIRRYQAGQMLQVGVPEPIIEMQLGSVADPIYTMDELLDASAIDTYEEPVIRGFQDLVARGDWEGAKVYGARQLADWSQFKYGLRNLPEMLRGSLGRMGTMFGSFSGQFIQGMRSVAQGRSVTGKLKAVAWLGALGLGYKIAEEKTGWNFSNWAWWNVLGYGGSPVLETAITVFQAGTGATGATFGEQPLSQQQEAAMREIEQGALGRFVGGFNPYAGAARTLDEYYQALQGTNPMGQIARYTVTGERGTRGIYPGFDEGEEMRRMLEAQARRWGPGGVPRGATSPNGGLMDWQPGPEGAWRLPQRPPSTHPGSGAQQ